MSRLFLSIALPLLVAGTCTDVLRPVAATMASKEIVAGIDGVWSIPTFDAMGGPRMALCSSIGSSVPEPWAGQAFTCQVMLANVTKPTFTEQVAGFLSANSTTSCAYKYSAYWQTKQAPPQHTWPWLSTVLCVTKTNVIMYDADMSTGQMAMINKWTRATLPCTTKRGPNGDYYCPKQQP